MEVFRSTVRRFVLPEYKLNDKGHQIGHADDVCNLALEINGQYHLGISYSLIVVASYLHDIFARHRLHHATLAALMVYETTAPWVDKLSPSEKILVEEACSEHRASYKGEHSSMLAQLISSADRAKPDNIEKLIQRIMVSDCIMANLPEHSTGEDQRKYAISFLKLKSGTNGYANYPLLYKRIFSSELKKFQEEIDAL